MRPADNKVESADNKVESPDYRVESVVGNLAVPIAWNLPVVK